MRFTNFGEKESFERKLKTPNLEKESFLKMSKFLRGKVSKFYYLLWESF